MTQFLAPLFGEYSTDQAIARATAARSGLTAKPVLVQSSTGSGLTKQWTVGLGVNADLGFWAWRTPWIKGAGAFQIIEDATIPVLTSALEPAAGLSRHILVVGRWGWIAGPIGGDGQPLGTFTANQQAAYEIIQGTDATTPVDPPVAALDAAQRPPVVLARIVFPQGGTPTIEYLPNTMLDLSEMGLLIDGKHNRTGDELHTGKFKVTEPPVDDLDVLRKHDQVLGTVKPFASFVNFWITVPDAWGNPTLTQSIPVANRTAGSGSDITYDTDLTLVKLNTTGQYLVLGETFSQYNTYQHDMVVEVFRRPVGTTGASDVLIHSAGMPNNNGGIDKPILCTVSATAGDWLYFKAVGKRSLSARIVITFLGVQAATDPLAITTPDYSAMAANGQVYPKIVTIYNTVQNYTGSVTWALTGGTAAGFTTMDAGGVMTINLPSAGSWTLSVQATDALGVPTTHTVNLTLSPYSVIPLVITNTATVNYVASAYPYAADIILTSTGGQSPITWSLVTGVDTTLPSAAVAGTHLTGSIAAAGTTTARVRATDSATVPQVVELVINMVTTDYVSGGGGGGGGGCFDELKTFVLMGDGAGKQMALVNPGDTVKGVNLEGLTSGLRQIRDVLVTDKTRVEAEPDDPKAMIIEGITCTKGHPFAVGLDFKRADELQVGDILLTAGPDNATDYPLTTAVEAKEAIPVRSTIGTRAGTYFVGKTEQGPWFLVHNIKSLIA
jgi:hypothetical protein